MEIEFGEIQHYQPDQSLRPDEDPRLAVVTVGEIVPDELPIFVDLDVMRDMENHARTNTSVELGGVMLGHQYRDAQDQPFVLVTDCLRAEHYEATKGSFKFTHETWQAISRQRDQYPDGTQMVGWYHTHPDWGVFLSGMDLFICNNFFNRPLDIALVIDPCRDDRGWFQWNNLEPVETRQTAGFHLMASRFRENELQYFANLYQGNPLMADSRYNPIFNSGGGQPVVNIHDGRTPIQNIAIMSMLTIQLLVLCLLAWRLLSPANEADSKLSQISESVERLQSERMDSARLEAYRDVLSLALTSDDAKLAEELAQARRLNDTQQLEYQAQLALARENRTDLLELARKRNIAEKDANTKKAKIKDLESEVNELKNSGTGGVQPWVLAVGGLLLAGFCTAGGYALSRYAHPPEFDDDEPGTGLAGRESVEPEAEVDPAVEQAVSEQANPDNLAAEDSGIEFENDKAP